MERKLKRESSAYLKDILEAIRRVKEYTHSLDLEEFLIQKMVVDAVMRNLEIIGEAVTQLPENIKIEFPEVPWREVKDFRNVVAHKYFKINLERIWDIIENKLDALEEQILTILKKKKE